MTSADGAAISVSPLEMDSQYRPEVGLETAAKLRLPLCSALRSVKPRIM